MTNKVLTEEAIVKLGRLARLEVGKEEAERLSNQLSEILDYVKQLDRYDVSNVSPMSHVHGSTNVFREDGVEALMSAEVVREIAPDASGNFFRTPIIVDQDGGEA